MHYLDFTPDNVDAFLRSCTTEALLAIMVHELSRGEKSALADRINELIIERTDLEEEYDEDEEES